MRVHTASIAVLFSLFAGLSNAHAEGSPTCSVQQELVKENGKVFYTINGRARSLYMISRDLYGDEKYWKAIATWNKLAPPYHLELGQRLWIKKAPTLDEHQSNKALMAAWLRLDDIGMVHRLSARELSCEHAPRSAEVAERPAPLNRVPELVSVVPPIDLTPALQAGVDTAETRTVEVRESRTVAAESAEVTPAENVHEKLENVEHEQKHGHWGAEVALVSSAFRLKNESVATGVVNKLNSDIDFGIEGRLAYELSDRWEIFLGAGYEKAELKAPKGIEIHGEKQDVTQFSLGVEFEVASPLAVYLAGRSSDRLYARSTEEGASVDKVAVTEAVLGDRLSLYKSGNKRMWLLTEGSYSMKKSTTEHEIKAGYGYVVGLQFDVKIRNTTLTLLPSYRFLKLDTETAKNSMDIAQLNLGLVF